MSFRGMLLKMGLTSDGYNLAAFRGNITARNIAQPFGAIYYVSKGGSDDYGGYSWEKSFLTLAKAIAVCRARVDWGVAPWAKNDIIMVGPGVYAENLIALPHGCMIVGPGWDTRDAQFGAKIKPASGDPIDVGGVINSAFFNLGFETVDGQCFDSEIINNCLFDNCFFSGPPETSTQVGILANDCTRLIIKDCYLTCLDKGIDINYVDGGDKFAHCKIVNTDFLQIDTAGIEISSQLVGPSSIVDRCNFFGAGVTMGYAINDAIGCLDVVRCMAESTSGYSGVRSVNGSYNNGGLVT